MENTKKIVLIIISFLCLISCNSQNSKELHLTNNLFKDAKGNIIFAVNDYEKTKEQKGMTVKNDSIYFSHVYDIKTNEYKKNNEVIDWKTFRNIFNNPKNEKKVNDEQSEVAYNCYFEDKNNFYLYPFLGTKLFMIKGNNYEVLGGAYLKINNEIYWRAEKIPFVDLNTFKTIRLRSNVDYYQTSIGMDKNHLYMGNKIMTYDVFKENFSDEELKIKYFKKEK